MSKQRLMRNWLFVSATFLLIHCGGSQQPQQPQPAPNRADDLSELEAGLAEDSSNSGWIQLRSEHTVDITVRRAKHFIEDQDLKVMGSVNHFFR